GKASYPDQLITICLVGQNLVTLLQLRERRYAFYSTPSPLRLRFVKKALPVAEMVLVPVPAVISLVNPPRHDVASLLERSNTLFQMRPCYPRSRQLSRPIEAAPARRVKTRCGDAGLRLSNAVHMNMINRSGIYLAPWR